MVGMNIHRVDNNVEIIEDSKSSILYPTDSMIYKANQIITGKYTSKMTVLAHKVFNYSLSVVRFDAQQNRAIAEFSANELIEFLGVKHNSIYSQLYKVARCLRKKEIIMEDRENKSFYQMTLINVAQYKNGKMILKFEPDATDIVLNLKPSYSKLNKRFYKHFRNIYAMELYENLNSKFFKTEYLTVIYEIYDLKLTLGMIQATDDMVHSMCKESMSVKDAVLKYIPKEERPFEDGNVFKRALKKAVDEINEITDIHIEFELLSEGRGGKITRVRFNVTERKQIKQIDTCVNKIVDKEELKQNKPSEEEIFELMFKLKSSIQEELTFENYKQLLECANYNVDLILEKYEQSKKAKKIDNLVAWLTCAIKENYNVTPKISTSESSSNKSDKPINKFNDFQQRNYSDDEIADLEKKLLSK